MQTTGSRINRCSLMSVCVEGIKDFPVVNVPAVLREPESTPDWSSSNSDCKNMLRSWFFPLASRLSLLATVQIVSSTVRPRTSPLYRSIKNTLEETRRDKQLYRIELKSRWRRLRCHHIHRHPPMSTVFFSQPVIRKKNTAEVVR